MTSSEADRERWVIQLELFKARLAEVLDRDNEVWQDSSVTPVTKAAAELLGLKPGELNGYLEVWTELFSVMELEDALEAER